MRTRKPKPPPKIIFTMRIDPGSVERLEEIAKAKGVKKHTLAADLLAASIRDIDPKK